MCSAESWGFRFTKLSLTGEYHARQREFAAEFGPCQGRWDLRESKDRSVLSEVIFFILIRGLSVSFRHYGVHSGLESSTRRIRASLPDFLDFLIPL